MNPPDNTVLEQLLRQAGSNSLWYVAENLAGFVPGAFAGQAISNRLDIVRQLQQHHIAARFDDFVLPQQRVDRIIWRISKEKAINLHLLHNAPLQLADNGRLHVLGQRQEGIDSLYKYLQQQHASVQRLKHKKGLYELQTGPASGTPDNHYHLLQPIDVDGLSLLSKPGVFGWNKVDAGSRLLVDHLPALDGQRVLDLGCGYGYLAVMAHRLGAACVDATDNNAAAIIACQANLAAAGSNGQVIAGDCGDALAGPYDLVLCNPPFHQGFAHDTQLTRRFCQAAARLLAPHGRALFVVNQFIGLEKAAAGLFARCEPLAQRHGFRLLQLTKT